LIYHKNKKKLFIGLLSVFLIPEIYYFVGLLFVLIGVTGYCKQSVKQLRTKS